MAKKRGSNGSNGSRDADGWRGKIHFVDFSRRQEDEVKLWYSTVDGNVSLALSKLLDSGWGIKLTPPSSGDLFWCSVTCKIEGNPLEGHTLTVRYPDMEGCFWLAYYVVFVMLERGELSDLAPDTARKWLG